MSILKKILICGLGSMGKRRIGILQSEYSEFELVGTDTRRDRCEEVESQFNIKTISDYEKAFSATEPFAVFVCTPPISHTKIVLYALENKAHTFSEINLSCGGYANILKTAKKSNRIAFLSSTFLYREEIKWIFGHIKDYDKLSYRYHVGQYLPDWHPWEKYTDFFVADKQQSACREILAIELPWMTMAFGKVKQFKVMKDRVSDLDLDYDDTVHLIIEHVNGIKGTLSIDCVSARGIRKLEIYSHQFYVEWEGTPESLSVYEPGEKKMVPVPLCSAIQKNRAYEAFIIENPYIE